MAIDDKKPKPMKDLEIISDPKTIKVLFEPTRAAIVFKYLVNGAMTVKQLADALKKNPGTILHHIDKLKAIGIVVQDRTEILEGKGVVQRFYRATAREYRLGLKDMIQASEGVAAYAQERLRSMVTGLGVYGITFDESEIPEAMQLLRDVIESENVVLKKLDDLIVDEDRHDSLSPSAKNDIMRIMRKFVLAEDPQYRGLRDKWHDFLQTHRSPS